MSSRPASLGPDIQSLSPDDRDTYLRQTERILDRHAEIQRDQRRQATRILQVYIAILGVLVTAAPFVARFINNLDFTIRAGPVRGFLGAIAIAIAYFSFMSILGDLYDIPFPATEVLSPKSLKPGLLRRLFSVIGRTPSTVPNYARGDTRTVSRYQDVERMIVSPNYSADSEILLDRMSRIDRNEDVINYNISKLQDTYNRVNSAIRRFGIGVLVGAIALWLLGIQLS